MRLDDRRHVHEENAAGAQHAGDRRRQLPRLRQIEHDPIDRLLLAEAILDGPQPHHEVADLAGPHVDVGQRAAGELLALLVGDDASLGADGAQQRERQGAGAGAGLQHATARVDVGPEEDHGEVLGIDHLGAPRHLQHELGQRRPEREVA